MRFLLPLLCLLLTAPAHAQWQNLNSGGGGQIQDIVLDPNTPARAFWCSDMEGAYRSVDGGNSWQYIGKHLSHSNTLTIAVEKGNSDRLYAGTVAGVDISDDGGETWNAAVGLDSQPIMAVAINPRRAPQVVAAVGNRWRWAQTARNSYGRVEGERGVFVSNDRGKTWDYRVFEAQIGRRDTFSLDFSPDGQTLWVGARAGLYRSNDGARTFQKIAAPANTGDCWGATLTPDGKRVYAFFDEGGGATRLFSRDAEGGEWTDEFARANFDPRRFAQGQNARPQTFWLPRLDPRSTPNQTRLIFAAFSARNGLFEARISPQNAQVERVFFYARPQSGGFDSGWEEYLPRPLAYAYSPLSWPKREIWTTGDQTLFSADATTPDFSRSWRPLYTQFSGENGGQRFYQTRGAQSTFLFGAAQMGDFLLQSNADNGVLESYDGGKSWTIGLNAPRSNAVAVLPAAKLALAHTSAGFGAAAQNGTLWLKHLETLSPRDRWRRVGGGREEVAGLPNTLYNHILPDPRRPNRVFIGTQARGLWLIDDVASLERGEAQAREISANSPFASGPINDKGSGLAFDPNRAGVIYLAARREIWRGDETLNGTWNWTRLRRGTDGTVHVLAAKNGDQTRLIASVQARSGPAGAVGHGWFEISDDGGENWRRWLGFDAVKPLRHLNWLRPNLTLQPAGATVWKNHLFFAFGNWETGRAYGVFEADLTAASPKPRDITGNLPFAWAIGSTVVEENERNTTAALLFWTRGCGLWRLPLSAN